MPCLESLSHLILISARNLAISFQRSQDTHQDTMAQGIEQASDETSTEQLKSIIRSSTVHLHALPGYEKTSLGLFGRAMLNLDCDEVYPNLYVSDKNTALNKAYLLRLGITHVLNVAEGNFQGMVPTNAMFYADMRIHYMGIPLIDVPSCSISPYFTCSAEFIDQGIKAPAGKVLVHCEKGYSRSPTVVLIYLALKVHMRIPMALKMCCSQRNICPNDGFLNQLSMLDNCMRNA